MQVLGLALLAGLCFTYLYLMSHSPTLSNTGFRRAGLEGGAVAATFSRAAPQVGIYVRTPCRNNGNFEL